MTQKDKPLITIVGVLGKQGRSAARTLLHSGRCRAVLEIFSNHFPEFSSNEILVREILGMVEYAVEYEYFRKDRDLLWSREINPDSLNWEQFLRTTGWKGQKLSY